MAAKKLSAAALQGEKTKLEVEIARIIAKFNKMCAYNDFQVESLKMVTFDTDEDRTFDVDIAIV